VVPSVFDRPCHINACGGITYPILAAFVTACSIPPAADMCAPTFHSRVALGGKSAGLGSAVDLFFFALFADGFGFVDSSTRVAWLSSIRVLPSFNLRVVTCFETRVTWLSSMLASLTTFARFVGLATDLSSSRGDEDRLAFTFFETTFGVPVTRTLPATPLMVGSKFLRAWLCLSAESWTASHCRISTHCQIMGGV
jgi:hypothetical protein